MVEAMTFDFYKFYYEGRQDDEGGSAKKNY